MDIAILRLIPVRHDHVGILFKPVVSRIIKPMESSLFNEILWSTVSKASERSAKSPEQCQNLNRPLSRLSLHPNMSSIHVYMCTNMLYNSSIDALWSLWIYFPVLFPMSKGRGLEMCHESAMTHKPKISPWIRWRADLTTDTRTGKNIIYLPLSLSYFLTLLFPR